MANKFVWSGATGANDGSSWDNAYTTLMRDWGAEAGVTPATDYIYVRSVHSETSGSTLTITGSTAEGTTAACRVICVVGDTTGTTPGNLATGADVNTNATTADIVLNLRLYIYGVEFYSNNDLNVSNFSDGDIALEQCRLELTGVSGTDVLGFGPGSGVGSRVKLIDTTVDFGNTSQGYQLRLGDLVVQGGAIAANIAIVLESPSFSNQIR